MGNTGTAPAAGHGWLAKVLGGDPVACWALALARALPDAELDALILHAKQMGAGVLATDAAATAQREIGRTSG